MQNPPDTEVMMRICVDLTRASIPLGLADQIRYSYSYSYSRDDYALKLCFCFCTGSIQWVTERLNFIRALGQEFTWILMIERDIVSTLLISKISSALAWNL
ncbi:unnamed protein product [Linum trigynum]|uniref:Uncharacterized protein n=1 Tax=Linum trigynum TaxID=586398 RepID=A0AAV2DL44_9ROSI